MKPRAEMFSRIVGTGSYLPERVVTNAELESRIETTDEWIVSRTGIEARHVAADGEMTSDLALHAARKAMRAANVTPADIDLIVCATTTPDMVFPSTACILQDKLGVRQGAAFDVQAVCTGFIYALATADKFIATGGAKCALVVGAEVFSRLLDWNDRRTCVLFGDGAGAVVIKPSDRPGILSSHLHADGSQGHILRVAAGLAGGELRGHPFLEMDGKAVFKLAIRVLDKSAEEALAHNGLKSTDLDWFIPHQANLRIIDGISQAIGLPAERVIRTVARHGNTSAASVPLALDTAVRDARIQDGHLVLLQGVGGGMTWGSVLLRW
ncbi:MAG TPA: beta-ketoacyl-ACP synthase III [Verrucomicrobiae bacterium]|nr:beta-ketoacyl-ACP synthase III [Verrucomicrobiae bacterium]